MADFDNVFDTAMSRADEAILDVMATTVSITSGALAGMTLAGVFDDPECVSYAAEGVRIEGTSPCIFVKSPLITQLKRLDTITINGEVFWVDRKEREDVGGSCCIWLGRGMPPATNRRR
ncbi:TPA: phage tail protein [Salmonella enterica subsp. salamae serovar 9,46:z4,z24:z39:z42]|nr:phage tail protein [Salmonella enterica subsp. salamae serovar 9,46:z4,z24:z39:z42]